MSVWSILAFDFLTYLFFCTVWKERIRKYWTASEFKDPPVLHFRAGEKQWRLLTHFYGLMHFTDPAIDNYAKRFVRDFLHYHDQIYCAAAKIVKALQVEAIHHGWPVDSNGAGGYSSMHIRRGEFQYKRVKIPAEEWYENTKEVWKPNELIYIATDERNKTFFDPIAKHHPIRFLDDYMELANLKTLGMYIFLFVRLLFLILGVMCPLIPVSLAPYRSELFWND